MSNIEELAGELAAVNDTLTKAKAEIVAKIDALTAALANQELPEAAVAALESLKETAQALDELNPDVTPTP